MSDYSSFGQMLQSMPTAVGGQGQDVFPTDTGHTVPVNYGQTGIYNQLAQDMSYGQIGPTTLSPAGMTYNGMPLGNPFTAQPQPVGPTQMLPGTAPPTSGVPQGAGYAPPTMAPGLTMGAFPGVGVTTGGGMSPVENPFLMRQF